MLAQPCPENSSETLRFESASVRVKPRLADMLQQRSASRRCERRFSQSQARNAPAGVFLPLATHRRASPERSEARSPPSTSQQQTAAYGQQQRMIGTSNSNGGWRASEEPR